MKKNEQKSVVAVQFVRAVRNEKYDSVWYRPTSKISERKQQFCS